MNQEDIDSTLSRIQDERNTIQGQEVHELLLRTFNENVLDLEAAFRFLVSEHAPKHIRVPLLRGIARPSTYQEAPAIPPLHTKEARAVAIQVILYEGLLIPHMELMCEILRRCRQGNDDDAERITVVGQPGDLQEATQEQSPAKTAPPPKPPSTNAAGTLQPFTAIPTSLRELPLFSHPARRAAPGQEAKPWREEEPPRKHAVRNQIPTTPPKRNVPKKPEANHFPALGVLLGALTVAGIATFLAQDLARSTPETQALSYLTASPVHTAMQETKAVPQQWTAPSTSRTEPTTTPVMSAAEEIPPATSVPTSATGFFSAYQSEILSKEEEAEIGQLGLGVSGEALEAAEQKLRSGTWPTGNAGRVVMAKILRDQFPRVWAATGKNPLEMNETELRQEFMRLKNSRYFGHLLRDLPSPRAVAQDAGP